MGASIGRAAPWLDCRETLVRTERQRGQGSSTLSRAAGLRLAASQSKTFDDKEGGRSKYFARTRAALG
eukprot:CAMPEP_0198367736 /NCGR_PEP_ID=MMETSP1450-20131203/155340_1 /TAXON_ID=753684 ORGANISM="Madagascaria erythrocladiodes, Strain CCMP3234" /NCGR_SAMPLE_ID=MMETSP1450 /ASSEMBLY_ACC=CAM_ASM_001115 /LENGTH=67 /DNA_ID=CAMNT_0044075223 /DNA_START=834 /DNA_END=1038 /DNA_ORIENTATION=+